MTGVENFTNYNIDIADIFLCEQNYFITKRISSEFASHVLRKIQSIIVENNRPNRSVEMYDSNNNITKTYLQYQESLVSLEERFFFPNFFSYESCYEYYAEIIITNKNADYNFWFTLKLRQYDGNVKEIDNFLAYQLKKNFKKKFLKFH